ncbi:MAG: glycerophosphodiester phosphodiesterase [Saprospirales bacterium]|nr:glycerophosphodiester phosphodiesterase [Saprospirales bacterium]
MFFFAKPADAQKPILPEFDWQGHRGCRGLLPENTIPAFLKALEYPVTTLELDLAVSKDRQLIISHDPWMHEGICSKPDGDTVTKSEAKQLKIFEMTYEEIKGFDCGSHGNPRFPQQKPMKVYKPSFRDIVQAVKTWTSELARPLPQFNIEIKSKPAWDNVYTPEPEAFVDLLLEEIEELGIEKNVCIQSFDVRPLQILHRKKPDIKIALLIENMGSIKSNLEKLGFQPAIYSPYYKLLRRRHIRKLHRMGIAVIPWTVNTVKAMKRLRKKGVDGIITDYPNLIEEVEKDQ